MQIPTQLALHGRSRSAAVAAIAVQASRPEPGRLHLQYGLWRTTCFEAFLRAPAGTAYTELNFAPSTAWAAYRFRAYREDMQVAKEVGPPRIETRAASDRFELRASLTLDGLPRDEPWQLGLSAVIEESDGSLSYWALAHPPGKADFHHSDCFAAVLPSVLGTTSSK